MFSDEIAAQQSGNGKLYFRGPEERRASRSALEAAQASARTFKQCAAAYMDAHCRAWRNRKHIEQWRSTLQGYAYTVIGDLQVGDVQLPHVLRILEPIWHEKTETASRLRGRIERILHWAIECRH